MNEDRNPDRIPKPPVRRKRPVPWQQDLHPTRPSGRDLGRQSDAQIESEWTAFHLRKRGLDSAAVNEEELEQVPAPAKDRGRP
jgi:hypothetical protein